MKKFILFFLSLIIINHSFSQINSSTIEQKHYLQFKIVETEIQIGKYVNGNADSLGFVPYNGKLIERNIHAENRMITLRSTFVLDKSLNNKDILLVFPPVFYACNIYLNGLLIAKRGNIENGYTNRIHYTEHYFLPNSLLHYGESSPNEIALELLSKQNEHSSLNGLFISSRKTATSYTFWRNTFSINFVRGMSMSSFFIFLYTLIFYFKRRNKKYTYYLPFAFVALLYSFAFLNNIANFDFSNNYILEIITRVSFSFWNFFAVFYLLEYSQIFKHKNLILSILAIIMLPLSMANAMQKDVESVVAFYVQYGAIFNFVVDLFMVAVSFLFLIRKPSYPSIFLFASNLICILAVIHDTYFFVVLHQKPYLAYIPYSVFLMILTFFFILSWEQSEVYTLAQQKSEELKELNKNLEKIVTQRTNQALASDLQFRSIFDNSLNAIFLCTKTGEYITVNPSCSKIIGYPINFFENKPIGFLTHPDDFEKTQLALHQLIQNKLDEYNDEIQILNSQNQYIWIDLRAKVSYNAKNEFEFIVGTFNNITERKNAEQALIENQTLLKELDTSKNIFMSILAHDLRNPFNTLLGFTDLLLSNLYTYPLARIEKQLKFIKEIALNTFNLLEDLLLWSKSQSGKLPFSPQNIILQKVITEIVENLRNQAEVKKIRITYSHSPDIQLFADEYMLKTILRNLISNAIKFTDEHGSITIYAEEIAQNVVVTVADTGIGIAEENQAKLWEMSQKFVNVGTANESGTGLGLLLCKEFVEKHGGKIWVESEENKGSEFIFSLPLAYGLFVR